jgi:hypothetical protein
MIRSESLDEIASALSKAQGEFEAVDKTAANPFFKSKFAPLPEVVKAAAPILTKHGLSVWQGPDSRDDTQEVLWTVVMHGGSGQYIGSAMQLRPIKGDPQAQGSAISYGRRYAYMAALGLVADEDDDGEKAMQRPKPASRAKPSNGSGSSAPASKPPSKPEDTSADAQPASNATLAEVSKAFKASGRTGDELRSILTEVGVPADKGTKDLTEDQATWVVIKLGGSGEGAS